MAKLIMVGILLLIWVGGCLFSSHLIALMYRVSGDGLELFLSGLMAFMGLLPILLSALTYARSKFNKD